ncbi:MAG: Lrp/AsnC family transcriptional regulator [Methanomassiliicoccales archaeon]
MNPKHLDLTDIVLLQMLLSDSRASYREMADFLRTTPDEVEDRIRTMVQLGVLRSFVVRFRPEHLGAVGIFVYGNSEITKLEEAVARLCQNNATSWLGIGTGGRIYIGALLRRLSHLDSYISFLKEEGIKELVFGIRTPPPNKSREALELNEIDMRIIRALRIDARKSSFEMAKELGYDVELIENRIKRMREGGAIDFSITLSPEATSDILCMFHVYHKVGMPLREFMRTKLNEHSPNILSFNAFRNLPDLITALAWVRDMSELRIIKSSLEGAEGIERVEANILLTSRTTETWADAIIKESTIKRKFD